MKKILIASAIIATLAGCMSVGTKVDPNVVSTFKPGVTTLAQAEKALGKPNLITHESDGKTQIQYTFTHVHASGTSYIPLVGGLVGHSDADTVNAFLEFDQNGNYTKSWTSEGHTAAGLINHS